MYRVISLKLRLHLLSLHHLTDFNYEFFFVLNNYRFILKNQTDFRKTVESGMGPRSSSYINITKNKGNKI